MLRVSHQNPFKVDVAREVLAEVDDVLKVHGCEYIMVGGTLLGFVRHGEFMTWDDDIDLLLHFEHIKTLNKQNVFKKLGWFVKEDWYTEEYYLLQIFKHEILVDLWPARIHPEEPHLLETLAGDYPIDKTIPPIMVEFEGGVYPIPRDPYYYLDRNIGPSWEKRNHQAC